MRPEIIKYLQDVGQACQLLEQFTAGRSFADYQADALLYVRTAMSESGAFEVC